MASSLLWFYELLLTLNRTHRCRLFIFSYLSHSCHIVLHSYRLTHAYGNIQTSNNKSSLPSLLSFLTRKSGSCGQTPPCSRQWYGPLLDDHGVHSPPPRLPPQRTRKPPFPMSHLMRENKPHLYLNLFKHQCPAVCCVSTYWKSLFHKWRDPALHLNNCSRI